MCHLCVQRDAIADAVFTVGESARIIRSNDEVCVIQCMNDDVMARVEQALHQQGFLYVTANGKHSHNTYIQVTLFDTATMEHLMRNARGQALLH